MTAASPSHSGKHRLAAALLLVAAITLTAGIISLLGGNKLLAAR